MSYHPIEDCIKALIQYALDEELRNLRHEMWRKKRKIEVRLKKSQNNVRYHQLVNEHFASAKIANEAFNLLQRTAKELRKIDELIKQAKQERKACKTVRNFFKANYITRLIAQLAKIYADLKQERDSFNAKTHELNDKTAELRESIRNNCSARGKEWFQRLQARKT